MPLSIHIGDGFVRLGGVTLAADLSARGLEVGDDAVLRPISFGLRTRLIAWSGEDLPEALLAQTMDGEAPDLDPLALQVLALHLAGANSGAPGFAASAALVARLLGWPLADINAGEALEIDRLAASLAPSKDQAGEEGWTTVVFAPADGADGDEDEPLDALCARLVDDLHYRANAAISKGEAAVLSSAPPAPRAFGDDQVSGDQQAGTDGGPAAFGQAGEQAGGAATAHGQPQGLGPNSTAPEPASSPGPWTGQDRAAERSRSMGLNGSGSAAVDPAPPPQTHAQPHSEHGAGASAWDVTDGKGSPTFGDRPGPANDDGPISPFPASTSSIGAEQVEFSPHLLSLTQGAAWRADPARNRLSPAPVPAARLQNQPAAAGMRAGTVAPFAQAGAPIVQTDASTSTSAPPPVMHATSGTPVSAEPALDLDAVSDALHAIADLRGVAR